MREKVKLLRASAGAGKTHRLTQEYIRMLLQGDDEAYRHILAVTFTNKATDEMKSRILEELYRMSSGSGNPASAGKARRALIRILNDYTGFGISTIDRFFQTVVRSFAREIGQYASYKVELDTDDIISMAVDRMLDSLGEKGNEDLLDWLRDYAFQVVEEGGNWNISGALEEMAKLFFKEEFKLRMLSSGALVGDRETIRKMNSDLSAIISSFAAKATGLGKEALRAMSSNGLGPESFKGKSRGPFMVFKYLAQGQIRVPNEKLRESFAGNQVPELESIVEGTLDLFRKGYRTYASALVIRRNLSLLGVYSDLYGHINRYLKENNLILLSETSDLLSGIIDGNDTPFVYEKTGNRYDHIMLDEAQDTSVIQWRNFSPLFRESLSKGFGGLVVGDIKQSIYRWRGSDWRLMSDYIFEDLGGENIDGSEALEENWRSGASIIDFNNLVFSKVGVACNLGDIYDGCSQTLPSGHKDVAPGRVKVRFLEGRDWKEAALSAIVRDIRELEGNGYDPGDITVLVRKNAEGSMVASRLMQEGISVITEDSLLIGSSPCVAGLVDILRYFSNPGDQVCSLTVEDLIDRIPENLADGSLYEMCEDLIRMDIVEFRENDVPFIHAFLDSILEFQDKFGSSVRGFIQWWDDTGCKKSICAPSGMNAVRIMTIHKAKGLGLEAVIIPFLEEKFNAHTETVWMEPPAPFNQVGLVPIKATKQLEETVFAQQYENECLLGRIDCVNTAYVALTRAKRDLVVYAPDTGRDKSGGFSSFAGYLHETLSPDLSAGQEYLRGEISPPVHRSDRTDMVIQDTFAVEPAGERLTLTLGAEDYFDRDCTPKNTGIRMHGILEKVNLESDLEAACEGDAEAFELLSAHLASIRDRHWFDGTYTSLNETSISDEYGNVLRPDRILLSVDGKRAVVIDYKFGAVMQKHLVQIERYCRTLERMGFEEVEGHIWYVSLDKTVSL